MLSLLPCVAVRLPSRVERASRTAAPAAMGKGSASRKTGSTGEANGPAHKIGGNRPLWESLSSLKYAQKSGTEFLACYLVP